MRLVLILSALALAGCGADGEPIRPKAKTTLSVGSDGVSVRNSVSVGKGPFTLGINL